MKRYLKIFWLFTKYSYKMQTQNTVSILLFIAAKSLRFILYFLFVFQLLSRSRFLAGYSIDQTLVFFLTYNVIDTFSQVLFREVYRFRPLVVSGELDSILLKPYHPFLRVLMGGIDILDVFMLIPYIIMLALFISRIPHITIGNISVYILLMFNALFIALAFHIAVLALGILTTEVDNTTMIYRDISRMVSLPIDIYREPLRSVLTFVIPVGIMMAFPVKGLLGILQINLLVTALGMAVTFLLISLFMWNFALSKYQSRSS